MKSLHVVGGPIEWRMHIPVHPMKVFQMLATNEGRASFWAESAVERNGTIHFRFINGATCESRIIEARAPDVFSVEYFGTVARFELRGDGRGGTELLLTNSGAARDEWHEMFAGWLNVLFPLKAWLMGSLDLRNHDPQRVWERGYADQ